jgi:hypothetical protein
MPDPIPATCIANNTLTPPPPIPAECNFIHYNIDIMKADLAEYRRDLKTDPDKNKVLLQNAIDKLTNEIVQAEDALADCKKNNAFWITPRPWTS